LFASFGAITEARVILRSTTGKCRGFGYVTFTDAVAAERALASLDGILLSGHRLRVDFAR
jgi:RNA recognition motif-containing protein